MIAAIAAAALMVPFLLGAQDGPPPKDGKGGPGGTPPKPMTASEMISKMKQELSLSDKQVSQIKPVIENEITQIDSIMSQERDGKITRDKAREKMDAVRKDTESKLSKYLTSDQMKKWKELNKPPKGGPEPR
jgi:coenzyme F420-reducing hydrogenase alpha subunit